MKISPVSYINRQIYKTGNSHFVFNAAPATDTVSFGAKRNMAQIKLEELENTFKNDVEPFMLDSKNLMTSVAYIGYNIQNAMEPYILYNTKLFNYQMKLSFYDSVDNPDYLLYGKVIDLLNKYDKNQNTFNYLKNLSGLDAYRKTNLSKNILDSAKLFEQNVSIEKLRPFYNSFNNEVSAFNNEILNINFIKASKGMQDNSLEQKKVYDECLAYAMMIPYFDAVKLKNAIEGMKQTVSDPKSSVYVSLQNIYKLDKEAQFIARNKYKFYNNKSAIERFVDSNSKFLNTDSDKSEVVNLYNGLKEKTDNIFNHHRKNIMERYSSFTVPDEPEFKELTKLVEAQEEANKKILETL